MQVEILDNDECNRLFGIMTETMMCTSGRFRILLILQILVLTLCSSANFIIFSFSVMAEERVTETVVVQQ